MGYNRRGFFPLWDTTENRLKMANRFLSIVSHNAGNLSSIVSFTTTESYAVYCIPEKFSALYPTMPQGFLPLYPTMEDIFLHCGIQRKRFGLVEGYNGKRKKLSTIVGYNGRGFFPFWDTTEEVFFRCGIQRKKKYNAEWYF
jgi:hypothetical protein